MEAGTGYFSSWGLLEEGEFAKTSRRLGVEGYMAGGPLFAERAFRTEWSYGIGYIYQDQVHPWIGNKGSLSEKGKGTGIALEAGARLNLDLFRFGGIFLECGYAYQVAGRISGEGSEIREDRIRDSWQGDWAVIREMLHSGWGMLELDLPTSFPPERWPDAQTRDFKLDLSGLQLRLGWSFRF